MADDKEQRTLPPTGKRIQKFLDDGDTGRSDEVNAAVIMIAGLCCIYFFGPWGAQKVQGMLRDILQNLDHPLPLSGLSQAFGTGVTILLPVFAVFVAIAIAVNYAQGSVHFTTKTLTINFERLNVFSNFKRLLLSKQTIVNLIKAVVKVGILGLVTYWVVKRQLPEILMMFFREPTSISARWFSMGMRLMSYGTVMLGVFSLCEMAYSRYDRWQRMKMTLQETKDEHKQSEGDGMIKGRRMRMHKEIIAANLQKEVPRADVIITNPTHLAVALRYDRDNWDSPRVTAKGADRLAMRIRAIARQHGIPIIENKPLARTLYRTVRVGQAIKPALYKAVAEIYAFLYRRREGGRR